MLPPSEAAAPIQVKARDPPAVNGLKTERKNSNKLINYYMGSIHYETYNLLIPRPEAIPPPINDPPAPIFFFALSFSKSLNSKLMSLKLLMAYWPFLTNFARLNF